MHSTLHHLACEHFREGSVFVDYTVTITKPNATTSEDQALQNIADAAKENVGKGENSPIDVTEITFDDGKVVSADVL